MSVQPGGPGTTVTCPKCGHADVYPGDAQAEIIHCDECRARIAHGRLMPRILVLPDEGDRRFVVVRAEKDGQPVFVELAIDRQLGGMLARELLSVCP